MPADHGKSRAHDKDDKPSLSFAEKGTAIAAVEQRLQRRWDDTRVHAAALNSDIRGVLSSPVALVAAVGVGFGVAWAFPRAKPEPAESTSDKGAGVTTSILNALNFAGMVMSMFPSGPESGDDDTTDDPR